MAILPFADLFRRLQERDETVEIEAKASRELGDSLLETVSAFANEPGRNGGHLLCGVSPDASAPGGPGYAVTGVPDPDKLQRDLATQCATAFNVTIRPLIEVAVDPATGHRIVVAYIPEAAATDKPVYLRSRGLPRGAFRRIGGADIVCTEDDLHALFQLRGTRSYDETVVDGSVWGDLDPHAFQVYRRLRTELNPAAVELAYDDLALAQALFAVDRKGGEWVPTVAGLLLFGAGPALRRYFPMHRIDYLRIDGKEWVKDPDERYQGVEVREALLTAIPRLVSLIFDDIPKAMSLPEGQLGRREIPLLPVKAIREAVVNAVMHRNYRPRQPVQILRYSNRLEVRNAGASLKPDDQLGEPGSVLRNEKIAAVLHETPFAETKGSGIKVIRDTMAESGLLPPFFESDRMHDQFVATFLFHHFLSEEDVQWLAQFKDLHLSDEDVRALMFLREAGALNNAAYRMLNRVDTLLASSRLRALRDANLLEPKGKGSATYYLPGPRFQAAVTTPPPITTHTAAGRREDTALPAQQTSLPAQQTSLPAQQATPPDEPELPPDELQALRSALPEALREDLNRLGERATPANLEAVILRLCAWRPLTKEQLAGLTRRNPRHLRQSVLRRLIGSGQLEYLYPDTPTHQQQAYRAGATEGPPPESAPP
jgi:ATP-dependent DNA helicase RecG